MSHNCLQDCIDFQCCCSVLGSDRSFLWWHIIPVLSFCIPVKLTLVLYFIGRLCRKQYVILYESGWNGEVVSRKSCMCVYSTATLQYVSPNPRPCQLPSVDWNSLINSSHLYAHKTYSFFLSSWLTWQLYFFSSLSMQWFLFLQSSSVVIVSCIHVIFLSSSAWLSIHLLFGLYFQDPLRGL